jgi:hypothetical protein
MLRAIHICTASLTSFFKDQTSMGTKTGNWLMAFGALIVFAGLCFLPAALGSDGDRTMLAGGFVVASAGLLSIAMGFYTKARSLGTPPASAIAPVVSKRSRSKANCDQCAQQEPVIQCRVHQLHLCADCLTRHYDFRSCAYVPSTRRGAPSKATAAAYSQSASN